MSCNMRGGSKGRESQRASKFTESSSALHSRAVWPLALDPAKSDWCQFVKGFTNTCESKNRSIDAALTLPLLHTHDSHSEYPFRHLVFPIWALSAISILITLTRCCALLLSKLHTVNDSEGSMCTHLPCSWPTLFGLQWLLLLLRVLHRNFA